MICPKCNKDNRDSAIFCRHCGEKLPAVKADPFASLIGLESVKKEVAQLVDTIHTVRARLGEGARVGANMLIMGASGTGKTVLASAVAQQLHAAGLTKQAAPIVVDAVDWPAYIENWSDNVKQLRDGVLIVDNVQKLVPDGESRDIDTLDILFSAMDRWDGNPVVILTGLPGGFREYVDANPSVTRKFEYKFNLDEYNAEQLTAICVKALTEKHKARIENDSFGRLERVFMHMVRHKGDGWGNAYEALRLADTAFYNMLRRGGDSIFPQDIPGEEHREKTAKEILAELDRFVGVDNIRAEVQGLINYVEDMKRNGETPKLESHYVFTGNPGTGKTTIARVFADILKAMGVLPVGQLVEADYDALVEGYVGQTPKKTNAMVDKAIGGVLFIDEAYTLTQDKQGFGKQAIDTLLKRLSDDSGKFVCIAAGYPKEMFDFIQTNPGLKRRFNQTIEFHDYNGPALTEIFRRLVTKEGYALDPEASAHLGSFFDRMYASRTKDFGNAGECNNLMIEVKKRYASRISAARLSGAYTPEMERLLIRDDIEGDASKRELSLDEVIEEMNKNFVGMQSVKDAVRTLGNNVAMMQKRLERGIGQAKPQEIHIRLTGNPGTGKTEVARTLGKMLKAIKVLPTDKVIEVDKSGLVGQHVGDTPKLTNEAVDRAMGGILFIDEAYTLADSTAGGFAKEAVETLMKRLEDDRGKFVCIFAGYPRQMDHFLNVVNPGLKSRIRFNLHIDDYTADELKQIFLLMARKEDFKLSPEAEKKMGEVVDAIVDLKDENFGNARTIRNLLSVTRDRMYNRCSMLPNLTDDDLVTIQAEDIPSYRDFTDTF